MDKLIRSANGFPGDSDLLDYFINTYPPSFEAVAKAYGQDAILWGVEDDGNGGLTAGAVIIDGEILPFAASAANAYIYIDVVTVNKFYDDTGGQGTTQHPAYEQRTARATNVSGANTKSFFFFDRARVPMLHDRPQIIADGRVTAEYDGSNWDFRFFGSGIYGVQFISFQNDQLLFSVDLNDPWQTCVGFFCKGDYGPTHIDFVTTRSVANRQLLVGDPEVAGQNVIEYRIKIYS